MVYRNMFLIGIGNISFELFLIHIHVRNIVRNLCQSKGIDGKMMQLLLIFIVSVALSYMYSVLDALIRKKTKDIKTINEV